MGSSRRKISACIRGLGWTRRTRMLNLRAIYCSRTPIVPTARVAFPRGPGSATVAGVPAPDFVAIGHVTLDRFGDTVRPGGAALFAAVTAHRLGLSAGILTSHGDDFPLELSPPRIRVVGGPATETT